MNHTDAAALLNIFCMGFYPSQAFLEKSVLLLGQHTQKVSENHTYIQVDYSLHTKIKDFPHHTFIE